MTGKYINGDCMDHLCSFQDSHFDLAIVDPPYGIGVNKMQLGDGRFKKEGKNWDNNKPSSEYWDELFRISKNQIVFGANYFDLG
jgi:site-specific DNA-methyltransferase (adenine-specific)